MESNTPPQRPESTEDETLELRRRVASLERQLAFFRAEHAVVGRVLRWLVLGPRLSHSIHDLVTALLDGQRAVTATQVADVTVAVIRRTLIAGTLGAVVAVATLALLATQTALLSGQNAALQSQNRVLLRQLQQDRSDQLARRSRELEQLIYSPRSDVGDEIPYRKGRLVSGYVAEYIATQKQLGTVVVNLRGSDLRGLELDQLDASWVDFRGANLTAADFVSCNLSHSSFRNADLTQASIRASVADTVSFTASNLSSGTIEDTDLHSSGFMEATLTQTSFKNCNLTNTRFVDSEVESAWFFGCTLTCSDLIDVNGRARPIKARSGEDHEPNLLESEFGPCPDAGTWPPDQETFPWFATPSRSSVPRSNHKEATSRRR